jgi:hypothetical protein
MIAEAISSLLSEEKMDTVTDMIQNTPLFGVAAQGLIIANQNQSGLFDRMGIICFATADSLFV